MANYSKDFKFGPNVKKLLSLTSIVHKYEVTAQQVKEDAEKDKLHVYSFNGSISFTEEDVQKLYKPR